MCAQLTTQQATVFRTREYTSNIKVKQCSKQCEHKHRSRLVRGLESTEAVRSVSLSALAQVASPITIRDATYRKY